jgi:probable phosphoglycerate mutase
VNHTIATTRLVLIRHAESQANADDRVQGWADDPRSARGIEQAHRLADWFAAHDPHVEVLYSSPLRRAFQTASAISLALDLEVLVRPGLRELYVGDLEDSTGPVFNKALGEPHFEERYNVETVGAFAERAVGTVHGLLAAHRGSSLMVVTHLGVICMLLADWFRVDLNRAWETYGNIGNTSLTEVTLSGSGGTWEVGLLRHAELPHMQV